MRKRFPIAVLLVAGTLALPARADEVTGKDPILCAIVEVNFCTTVDSCEQGPPWFWNVPDFLEIDLAGKEIRTTAASGQNRRTPIRSQIREEGGIVLQGLEKGRAFSFHLTEKTGELTLSVAAPGQGGVAFGTCTPKEAKR
jgi:hypothetical protein